jgi:hypothetical protein
MHFSPHTASSSLSTSANGPARPKRAEDLTYQAFTLAAALSLLVSLWIF